MFGPDSNQEHRPEPEPRGPFPFRSSQPESDSHGRASTSRTSPSVLLVEGNLLNQKVEVIVNSWNRNFWPYWILLPQGVSGAIKAEGGTQPFKEMRQFGVLPLGGARLTSAGTLPFKKIIHVAGINHAWRSSDISVRESVINALKIAQDEGFASIAFPAIGAGSVLRIGGREIPIWGISESRSLRIIEETARDSAYPGKIVIVKFRKTT